MPGTHIEHAPAADSPVMERVGVVRVAAAGDLHWQHQAGNLLAEIYSWIASEADLLLLAGDLTQWGEPAEAECLARELEGLTLPIFAVLGNHDCHHGHEDRITQILEGAGLRLLECRSEVILVRDLTVGVVGAKGFGGGFGKQMLAPFGEAEIKDFVRATRRAADALSSLLAALDTDIKLVVLHYSPVPDTVKGEPEAIYPFLGCSMLAEAIDSAGADLIVHGHAHRGTPAGSTPGGIPVRNVALSVLHRPYAVFELECRRWAASRASST